MAAMDDAMTPELDLPGFRFHPTEEELLNFYLKNIVFGKTFRFDIIGFLNIYDHKPWDLPDKAKIGEREWYFFVPRDKKHGSGGRPNRTTKTGFWKATGSDRKIFGLSEPKRVLGFRKTLVFYEGRAPRGSKTDWVMNEYRLPDTYNCLPKAKDIVLCKIYRKATSLKVLEQRAAMEEESAKNFPAGLPASSSPLSSTDTMSYCSPQLEEQTGQEVVPLQLEVVPKEEVDQELAGVVVNQESSKINVPCKNSLQLPMGNNKMPELQVPILSSMDWAGDQLWTQLNSPWLQCLTPNYANLLNFS